MRLIAFKDLGRVHKIMARKWLKDRGLDPEAAEDLPILGYIAVHDSQSIALGAVRKIEGGYGLIDSFLSNPEASPENRHEALNLILNQLLIDAKEEKMKAIYAFSVDAHTIMRGLSHGLEKLDHTVIGKSLS